MRRPRDLSSSAPGARSWTERRAAHDADRFFEDLMGIRSGGTRGAVGAEPTADAEAEEAERFFEDLMGRSPSRSWLGDGLGETEPQREAEVPWTYDDQQLTDRDRAVDRGRALQQEHTTIEVIRRSDNGKWQVRHRHAVPTGRPPFDDSLRHEKRSLATQRSRVLSAYGYVVRVRREGRGTWRCHIERLGGVPSPQLPSRIGREAQVFRTRLQAMERVRALESVGFRAAAERRALRQWHARITALPTFGTAATAQTITVPGSASGPAPTRPGQPGTVAPRCNLSITSEAELTPPANRARRRIAVTEVVTLRAAGATGEVGWSRTAGEGSLSAETGASVVFTAAELAGNTTIRARDAAGCEATIAFEVVFDYLITPIRLRAIFTGATAERIEAMTQAFNEVYERFAMNTCLRRAHFFAQVLAEVRTRGNPVRESMNYTPERLREVFGYYRDNPGDADRHGRVEGAGGHPADQEAIANHAYAGRNGNGDIASGDGWRFRGRGFLQVTGRANYTAVQQEIDRLLPDSGVDIVANPDDATTTRGGMLSAMAYWSMRNINDVADAGTTDANVDDVTRRINPGGPRQGRRDNFRTTSRVFRVAECHRP
jgi:putative chitinase